MQVSLKPQFQKKLNFALNIVVRRVTLKNAVTQQFQKSQLTSLSLLSDSTNIINCSRNLNAFSEPWHQKNCASGLEKEETNVKRRHVKNKERLVSELIFCHKEAFCLELKRFFFIHENCAAFRKKICSIQI